MKQSAFHHLPIALIMFVNWVSTSNLISFILEEKREHLYFLSMFNKMFPHVLYVAV